MKNTRVERLVQEMANAKLDGMLAIPGPNMVYLTGLHFHLSERPTVAIFPASGAPHLILPKLELKKGQDNPIGFQLHPYSDEEGPRGAFANARRALGFDSKRFGVEARRLRFLEIELLGGTARLAPADHVFAALRMRKERDELAAMRRAVLIAEAALKATLPTIRPGHTTEKDVASELNLQLQRAGSDPELPFAPFAATGANGANPHATVGDRRIEPGHLLTIDWGASHEGYFSDITRTYAVAGKNIPDTLRSAYDAMKKGNEAARAAVRPGVRAEEIDRAARTVIAAAGFGEYFTHRTGHGLGLEGHEEPDMREGIKLALEPGMTFTIEPGIYIPGLGGMRLEDDMVVTETGGESLTTLPRELQVIG